MKEVIRTVVHEIQQVLTEVNDDQARQLSFYIEDANRIFVTGEGRSGLMGKAFAMRLMHGGYDVYVTGETITPNIEKGDLLIAISGSGSTTSICYFAKRAKESGACVSAITTNKHSKLAEISDHFLIVPAATKKRLPEEPDTIQPLGNQFDQSLHLLLDAIIIYTVKQSKTADQAKMTAKHANME
ncbi:6-phospho-3-hexuloisomerase [Guptibacillus hwajinpoensis]|uniref:6-phospho-3-hexuloisomerase n=2 Tax=Guptibacillus hwajinpoensis TaxID=208199 RepID=A0ABU0JZQ8_9BACL|nr:MULTISPECIES: 6-phospho-3-hexuloisomerase [Alkalihalobacillus]KMM36853.1 6-phospho 3-hexuloisomerase [Alkalihalobacillus macyae]MDQ0482587.1 6-phospho-3-hexuloisomerase [Alkalihalobacillus hemicentroti]